MMWWIWLTEICCITKFATCFVTIKDKPTMHVLYIYIYRRLYKHGKYGYTLGWFSSLLVLPQLVMFVTVLLFYLCSVYFLCFSCYFYYLLSHTYTYTYTYRNNQTYVIQVHTCVNFPLTMLNDSNVARTCRKLLSFNVSRCECENCKCLILTPGWKTSCESDVTERSKS